MLEKDSPLIWLINAQANHRTICTMAVQCATYFGILILIQLEDVFFILFYISSISDIIFETTTKYTKLIFQSQYISD